MNLKIKDRVGGFGSFHKVWETVEKTSRVGQGVDWYGILSSLRNWTSSSYFKGVLTRLSEVPHPFSRGKIHQQGSFGWNVLENTIQGASQPNFVASGLGYDAQSRRRYISDYTAIITGMVTAHSNVVQTTVMSLLRKRLYLNSFYPGNGVDDWVCLCFSNLICIYMIAEVLPTEAN